MTQTASTRRIAWGRLVVALSEGATLGVAEVSSTLQIGRAAARRYLKEACAVFDEIERIKTGRTVGYRRPIALLSASKSDQALALQMALVALAPFRGSRFFYRP
jgi:hypothetical protein